jgi:hypothetical protein
MCVRCNEIEASVAKLKSMEDRKIGSFASTLLREIICDLEVERARLACRNEPGGDVKHS